MTRTDRFYLALLILCLGALWRTQLDWQLLQPVPPSPAPTPAEWLRLKAERCGVRRVAMPSPCSKLDH